MAFHKYNHGLVTSGLALTIEAFNATAAGAAGQTPIDDGNSNLIASVTRGVTGTFTVQLNLPYPPSLIACIPDISSSNGAAVVNHASYKTGSYNSTTGQFVLLVQNTNTQAADNPSPGDLIQCVLVFQRYSRI
jgi:hypothetical protein